MLYAPPYTHRLETIELRFNSSLTLRSVLSSR